MRLPPDEMRRRVQPTLIRRSSFRDIGQQKWDGVVSSSPEGWVFATSNWREAIMSVPEWGFADLSFALCEGSALLGIMPLQVHLAQKRAASSGWGLAGPVLSGAVPPERRKKLLGDMLRHAETAAREAGADFLDVGWSPLTETARTAPWGMNPFVELGFEDISSVTRMIDLNHPEDALWSGLSPNARQMVRKAEAGGCLVTRGIWSESLGDYYRVHRETYGRTGVTPHPKAYFDGIARCLAPGGMAILWTGHSPTGEPIAFHNDARWGDGSLYHTGCSTEDALASGLNYLLMWRSILGAKGDGCRWYEIGEVFPWARAGKDRGLTVFKSKFGGALHRHFKARKWLRDIPERPPGDNSADVATLGSPWREWWRSTAALGKFLVTGGR